MPVANPRRAPARAAPEGAIVLEEHLSLVRTIAKRLARTWWHRPAGLEFDDLVAHGTVGLILAARRFDPRRGVKFTTYASWRIRGAMLDALASSADWQRWRTAPVPWPPGSVDERGAIHARVDFASRVADALDRLPAVEAALVRGAVMEGRSVSEVARRVGLSCAQAGRRLNQGLGRLRARLSVTLEVA